LPEFEQLIEEENASMAEAYLPRPGPAPASDQPDKCLKCGTLAFNLSGALGKEGALKSGCLHGDAGLHRCRNARKRLDFQPIALAVVARGTA